MTRIHDITYLFEKGLHNCCDRDRRRPKTIYYYVVLLVFKLNTFLSLFLF